MEESSEVIALLKEALTKASEQANVKVAGEIPAMPQRVAKASCACVRKPLVHVLLPG